MKKLIGDSQPEFDFEAAKWPSQEKFPINRPLEKRKIETILQYDIVLSKLYTIITGFTSLSHLIDTFGAKDFPNLEKLRILIGFEPLPIGRKQYERFDLPKEMRDYWIKEGLSIMQGGSVMVLLDKINSGQIEFKFQNKLHAKIYVGDYHAVLGSANFSKNGLTEQQEANIRVESNIAAEKIQYDSIKLLADSFYEESACYNGKISKLLQRLIQQVSWQEALARAISEMIEGNWLDDYKNIISQLEQTKLWPTQQKGIAQGVTILQHQANVLIADPTGAGKTKLCAALILSLQHWLFEIGKYHQTESLIVCPPLVLSKWSKEFQSFQKISHQPRSMGLLSTKSPRQEELVKMLDLANILTIDEAHNYLSPDSNRTNLIKDNKADYKILITATPISRKVEDLLRLIELLDVDNLSDEDFETYRILLAKRRPTTDEDLDMLRNFISKFTVRRTKKNLNSEIDKNPSLYKNRLGVESRFPHQNALTYKTKETKKDIEIAETINELSLKLKGITHLLDFRTPSYEMSKDETLEIYVTRRINSGRALSIYQIRAALRSSHVALFEHIEGTEAAKRLYNLKGKKDSGNKLEKLQLISAKGQLPYKSSKFKEEWFPDWLLNTDLYIKACQDEIALYQQISNLAQTLSGGRELGKVQELVKAAKKHKGVVAFDSTVITLHYLRSLFNQHFPETRVRLASGSENEGDTLKVIEELNLEFDKNHQCLALCSDKMSESVDLQRASCLFLLDMPSVVRIVEQRIGRVDRMDSLHPSIDIYWPDDSDAFSLKADARLISTNDQVEHLLGSNFNVPQALRGKHFKNVDSIKSIQNEYSEFIDKDESWKGIQDSFQCIVDLKEGDTAIVSENTYEQYRDVSSDVRTRVSFLKCTNDWCFLALKGHGNKSPRWYFIDEKGKVHSENHDICLQLREHVSEEAKDVAWNNDALTKFIDIFKKEERNLLPPKKMRALRTAEKIIRKKVRGVTNLSLKLVYDRMLKILTASSNEIVDYERLAEEWISLLQPYIKNCRQELKRKKDVINYDALPAINKKIILPLETIEHIIERSLIADEIDKRIASCIIGVTDVNALEVEFEIVTGN